MIAMHLSAPPEIIPGWFPVTERENYEMILFWWTWFPLVGSMQWLVSWYGMGKTSVESRFFNLPGRVGWMTMEVPGFLTLLYTMWWVSEKEDIDDLPWQNKVLAGLFVIHYVYRAIFFPIMAPSMSPIHIMVWASALCFQLVNGTCIGAWLGGFGGPVTRDEWESSPYHPFATARFVFGIALFYLGLTGNYIHDDELREIRRAEARRQKRLLDAAAGPAKKASKINVDKVYRMPTAGLFRWILYPHYLCEWVEWLGFWIAAGGLACKPAGIFLLNEVASMLPRAVGGKRWYVERFGEEKVGKKWAVLPGVA